MENSITVIIPVYNEGEILNRTINHIRGIQTGRLLEIIVVDGNKENESLKFINDSGVIKIFGPMGRGEQMNLGADVSSGEILLFLHADTILPPRAFNIICETINSGKYVSGAFTLSFDNRGIPFRLISFGARLRCRLSKIPFGDQGIFISKKYFIKIGKYREIPLMEDVDLMRRVKRNGNKIFISTDRVITSARKWETEGIIFTTLKNWAIQILYSFGVSPERLARLYYRRTNGN